MKFICKYYYYYGKEMIFMKVNTRKINLLCLISVNCIDLCRQE